MLRLCTLKSSKASPGFSLKTHLPFRSDAVDDQIVAIYNLLR